MAAAPGPVRVRAPRKFGRVCAQPPELEVDVLVELVCRCVWPVPLATLETHGPMPWSLAAEADDLQLLTAAVTTSPWLVVLDPPDEEVLVSLLSVVSSELDELELELSLTVRTVGC